MYMTEDIKIFREMCDKHDLTYVFSDDYKAYSKGEMQYKELVEFSKRLPREVAVQIWNENVEKKIMQHSWNEHKWV